MTHDEQAAAIVKAVAALVAEQIASGDEPAMPSTHFDGLYNEPETWDSAWTLTAMDVAEPYVEALDIIVRELRP